MMPILTDMRKHEIARAMMIMAPVIAGLLALLVASASDQRGPAAPAPDNIRTTSIR